MSCFGGSEEQLYLLEVTIDKLQLSAEKLKDITCANGSDCTIVVKLQFLDFPTFEISQKDFFFSKTSPWDIEGHLDFSSGRTCLFVKQPRELVSKMQTTPMKIGIFREGETYAIAETEVALSGCLCDQISMTSNDRYQLPPFYILKGGYHLIDPGENPSGTINLRLKLSCFGKFVTTHYQLDRRSFYFKNDGDDIKYRVNRIYPTLICADTPDNDAIKCGDPILPIIQPDVELDQLLSAPRNPDVGKINDKTNIKKEKKKKMKSKK